MQRAAQHSFVQGKAIIALFRRPPLFIHSRFTAMHTPAPSILRLSLYAFLPVLALFALILLLLLVSPANMAEQADLDSIVHF